MGGVAKQKPGEREGCPPVVLHKDEQNGGSGRSQPPFVGLRAGLTGDVGVSPTESLLPPSPST